MTDTPTVEIPADVKDNNTRTVRVQWRSVRDENPGELESAYKWAPTFGYTVYRWDDTDKDGKRVTLSRFVNRDEQTVYLFATYYFTRVACGRGDWCYSYATYYTVVVDADGKASDTVPYCDEHVHQMRRNIADLPLNLHLSEPLIIGQHD